MHHFESHPSYGIYNGPQKLDHGNMQAIDHYANNRGILNEHKAHI